MNPHQKSQEDVVVTQEDREAARQFVADEWPSWDADHQTVSAMLTVAFARHRLLGHEAGRRDMREAAGWQPIETAPKDGRVLGFMPNRGREGRGYVAVIWWDDEFRADGWDEDADDVAYVAGWTAGQVGSFSYEEYAEEHPTHWMSLPALPTEPLGGEG